MANFYCFLCFRLSFVASITGYLALIFGMHFVPAPGRFPHIYPVAIALYSFLHYVLFALYFHRQHFSIGIVSKVAKKKD